VFVCGLCLEKDVNQLKQREKVLMEKVDWLLSLACPVYLLSDLVVRRGVRRRHASRSASINVFYSGV